MSDKQQSPIAFDVWWDKEIASRFADAMEGVAFDTMKTVARIAWRRGAYHAMTGNLTPPTH